MFRISKAFENDSVEILRIEGKITEENLAEWNRQISLLNTNEGRQIILDFAQVWFISFKAVEVLIHFLNDHIFILNCGMEVRNVLHASGLSARMLE